MKKMRKINMNIFRKKSLKLFKNKLWSFSVKYKYENTRDTNKIYWSNKTFEAKGVQSGNKRWIKIRFYLPSFSEGVRKVVGSNANTGELEAAQGWTGGTCETRKIVRSKATIWWISFNTIFRGFWSVVLIFKICRSSRASKEQVAKCKNKQESNEENWSNILVLQWKEQ